MGRFPNIAAAKAKTGAAEIADPVEQIVEASEVAETDENAQNGEVAG